MKNKIKALRETTTLTQKGFAQFYGIPQRTLESWEEGQRKPPLYVLNWLERLIEMDFNS